ncbi:VOC family protein [Cesiribacter andamanensis]|uniref:Putative enzyme n=1 Tax=Cesiribacter andamanensis AMV16 TaxID=1279009 RepID=M7N1A3_9BACT|nr:VOC family protein [Cesiribacter andamanensis]EMR00996.1 putative enzyme [Cesiribacter andamanensis AMV16]
MQTNLVGWFEIPVTDMNRAVRFYEQVFAVQLLRRPMGGLDMAWFPAKHGASGSCGSLIHHPRHYSPSSTDGVLIYFTSQAGDLALELSRVEAAGGRILQPKTLISKEIGFMALFLDSEGNRLALHSRA